MPKCNAPCAFETIKIENTFWRWNNMCGLLDMTRVFISGTHCNRMWKQHRCFPHMQNILALLELTETSLKERGIFTRHHSPFTDTVYGLMRHLWANASVSHHLPHSSSNLIHKAARVTLPGVTQGVSVSITSYRRHFSPLLFLCSCFIWWCCKDFFFFFHPIKFSMPLNSAAIRMLPWCDVLFYLIFFASSMQTPPPTYFSSHLLLKSSLILNFFLTFHIWEHIDICFLRYHYYFILLFIFISIPHNRD